MSRRVPSPDAPPLDRAALDRLALAYVGRYATTRAKLAAYLRRKLEGRGWAGEGTPPIEAVVARVAELGYVDDVAFAGQRAAALTRRGYGARRVREALRGAGVAADDIAPVVEGTEGEAMDAALAFARRRRIGPYAVAARDPDQRRRDLAALMRAGHGFEVARRVAAAAPGEKLHGH